VKVWPKSFCEEIRAANRKEQTHHPAESDESRWLIVVHVPCVRQTGAEGSSDDHC
jgi:hypothetical protein